MYIKKVSIVYLVFCLGLVSSPAVADSCGVADIFFGPVQLDIVKYDGYETAIVRSDTFDNPAKTFGAILGELTVDRGGFAVRKTDQEVIGTISPDLIVEGWDDVCDKKSKVEIVGAKKGVYIILNDGKPVGTISGRFPANGFGVK